MNMMENVIRTYQKVAVPVYGMMLAGCSNFRSSLYCGKDTCMEQTDLYTAAAIILGGLVVIPIVANMFTFSKK